MKNITLLNTCDNVKIIWKETDNSIQKIIEF